MFALPYTPLCQVFFKKQGNWKNNTCYPTDPKMDCQANLQSKQGANKNQTCKPKETEEGLLKGLGVRLHRLSAVNRHWPVVNIRSSLLGHVSIPRCNMSPVSLVLRTIVTWVNLENIIGQRSPIFAWNVLWDHSVWSGHVLKDAAL